LNYSDRGVWLSVVVPGLEKINSITRNRIDESVFLGNSSRPASRKSELERLRLADAGEWISYNGLDQIKNAKSDSPIRLHPII
jgi:hypothetical protein